MELVYDTYLETGESTRWHMTKDVPWKDVDRDLALSQPHILDELRLAALIESYAPMYALKSLELWWDSIEESAIASIQFYEEYKHFFALKKYLEPLGYDVPEREIIEVRQKNHDTHYSSDRVRQLANYMISEHFTAHFYSGLLQQAKEPVLRVLLTHLMKDEFRHHNVFYELLLRRIEKDKGTIDVILDEALNFRHMGGEVVGERMPVAKKNDIETMILFLKNLERLTGTNLIEYKKRIALGKEEPTA